MIFGRQLFEGCFELVEFELQEGFELEQLEQADQLARERGQRFPSPLRVSDKWLIVKKNG